MSIKAFGLHSSDNRYKLVHFKLLLFYLFTILSLFFSPKIRVNESFDKDTVIAELNL